MRLLHPTTLKIVSMRNDIPKTVISHVWSEIFKWKASGKKHPKMFIDDDEFLGQYMAFICCFDVCNLDESKIKKLGRNVMRGFKEYMMQNPYSEPFEYLYLKYFDDNYLFSDACSLYYKGINIFPELLLK